MGPSYSGGQGGPSLKEKRARKGNKAKQRVVKVYFNGGWKPDYQHTVRANRECLSGIKSQREGGTSGADAKCRLETSCGLSLDAGSAQTAPGVWPRQGSVGSHNQPCVKEGVARLPTKGQLDLRVGVVEGLVSYSLVSHKIDRV